MALKIGKFYKFSMLASVMLFSTTGSASVHKLAFKEIPLRAENPVSGTEFVENIHKLSIDQREEEIFKAVQNGNFPSFLRVFKPVQMAGSRNGQKITMTIWVSPDYLAIGNSKDYVRMPMRLDTAIKIAKANNLILPTTRMVDAIYQQAQVKLEPQPLPPSNEMTNVGYLWHHNNRIQDQCRKCSGQDLIAGHKKDLVLSNKVLNTGRLAIYGWHRTNGRPIQPLSTAHDYQYVDYSHGVRLVWPIAEWQGKRYHISQLLETPNVAQVLSNEGSISTRAMFGSTSDEQPAANAPLEAQELPWYANFGEKLLKLVF